MTLEEEKKLKPGDLVLVLVELVQRSEAEPDNWHGKTCVESLCLCPEDIHSVYEPARRKFKNGDIVRYFDELRYVINEQDRFGVLIAVEENARYGTMADAEELTLICPVEDRHDRKDGQ